MAQAEGVLVQTVKVLIDTTRDTFAYWPLLSMCRKWAGILGPRYSEASL
jgi:hypothetical protein